MMEGLFQLVYISAMGLKINVYGHMTKTKQSLIGTKPEVESEAQAGANESRPAGWVGCGPKI